MYLSKLEGHVAFITGSTRGIGAACAELLASQGCNVVINGHNNKDQLVEYGEYLKRAYGIEVLSAFGDISNPQTVFEIYKEIFLKFKKLDILVNNAGILKDAFIGMVTPDLVNSIIDTNIKGVLYNIIHASKLMGRNKSGSIINISSIVGKVGNEGQLVYSTSKAAVIGATLTAAKELAPMNIRVNAVAPGIIGTDMIKNIPDEKLSLLKSKIKLGRIGTVKDIAKAVLFLSSEDSEYISGQILGVDGMLSL